MATTHGLSICKSFVKGQAGPSLESIKRNYDKEKLAGAAASLGWFIQHTMGEEEFQAAYNLVQSSPSCGGGMEELKKAYKMGRLDPYREGALNAAKMSSTAFTAHMAKFGLDPYGDPLPAAAVDAGRAATRAAGAAAGAAEEVAAAVAALVAATQGQMRTQDEDPGAAGAGVAAGAPAEALMAAAVAAAEEAAAAAAALAGATQDWQESQASLLFSQDEEEQPGISLFDLDKTPVIPASQGRGVEDGAGDEDAKDGAKRKVSAPDTIDDHDPVGRVVDDPAHNSGNVRAPAATDPLIDAGGTVGRNGAAQSQAQAGSQVPGPAEFRKVDRRRRRKICTSIRSNTFCRDPDCKKEHPARCGDPRCFPTWRKDCPLWHVRVSQSQGNGASAGPGRVGHLQSQGTGAQGRQGQRQQRRGRQQRQQQGRQQQQGQRGRQQQRPPPPHQGGVWQRQQQHGQQGRQQQRPPPPLPHQDGVWQEQQQQRARRLPPLFPPQQQQHWQQHRPSWPEAGLSYRDVVAKGATGQPFPFQDPLLARLEALEKRLAGLAGLMGPCQF